MMETTTVNQMRDNVRASNRIVADALHLEYIGTESARSLKRMKKACDMVISYYNQYPRDEENGEKQSANILLDDIFKYCPEYLI